MITDRMNVELTDNNGNSWNITSSTDDGYYNGALGGDSGIPSHTVSTYGYSYNPARWDYSYRKPAGWDWVETDNSPTQYYPEHYWGATAHHGHGVATLLLKD